MADFLEKWYTKIKPYLFFHKKGFFELPYLGNSPQSMIESFAKMPFVTHSIQAQTISSNTEYMNATLHYEELEEGLWMVYTLSEFKANIHFKRMENKHIPADYYLLTLEVQQGDKSLRPGFINGIPYSGRSWLLFKPQVSRTSTHLKGTRQESYTLFFNEKWLRERLYTLAGFNQSNLWHFFESEEKFIITPASFEATDQLYRPIQDLIARKGDNGARDKSGIRKLGDNLLTHFANQYNLNETGKGLLELADKDRQVVMQAEKILLRNLFGEFPGIENIATETGVSSTKLKSCFKLVFEKTLFQYYQEKQMHYAHEMLVRKEGKVKDIAKIFGYENAGKFSGAFKKHFGKSPSDI
jgi:AraC-like DNA-binding protein